MQSAGYCSFCVHSMWKIQRKILGLYEIKWIQSWTKRILLRRILMNGFSTTGVCVASIIKINISRCVALSTCRIIVNYAFGRWKQTTGNLWEFISRKSIGNLPMICQSVGANNIVHNCRFSIAATFFSVKSNNQSYLSHKLISIHRSLTAHEIWWAKYRNQMWRP